MILTKLFALDINQAKNKSVKTIDRKTVIGGEKMRSNVRIKLIKRKIGMDIRI